MRRVQGTMLGDHQNTNARHQTHMRSDRGQGRAFYHYSTLRTLMYEIQTLSAVSRWAGERYQRDSIMRLARLSREGGSVHGDLGRGDCCQQHIG